MRYDKCKAMGEMEGSMSTRSGLQQSGQVQNEGKQ